MPIFIQISSTIEEYSSNKHTHTFDVVFRIKTIRILISICLASIPTFCSQFNYSRISIEWAFLKSGFSNSAFLNSAFFHSAFRFSAIQWLMTRKMNATLIVASLTAFWCSTPNGAFSFLSFSLCTIVEYIYYVCLFCAKRTYPRDISSTESRVKLLR